MGVAEELKDSMLLQTTSQYSVGGWQRFLKVSLDNLDLGNLNSFSLTPFTAAKETPTSY